MPSRRVGLASWGVTELELLLKHYGVQKEVGGKILPLLVNFDACKRELFEFKLQGTVNWNGKKFKDLWAMVT